MDELTINLEDNEEMSDRLGNLTVGQEMTATVTLRVNTADSEMVKFDVVDLMPDSTVDAEEEPPVAEGEDFPEAPTNAVTSLFS